MDIRITKGQLRKTVNEMLRQEKRILKEGRTGLRREYNPIKRIIREEMMKEVEAQDEDVMEEGVLKNLAFGALFTMASLFSSGGEATAQTGRVAAPTELVIQGFTQDEIKVERSHASSSEMHITQAVEAWVSEGEAGEAGKKPASEALEAAIVRAAPPIYTADGTSGRLVKNAKAVSAIHGKLGKSGKEVDIKIKAIVKVPANVTIRFIP